MLTTIVVDADDRDSAAVNMASVLSNRGVVEVTTLTDFLTKAGVSFDPEFGDLVWDQRAFTQHFEDPRSHRIFNRVVTITSETTDALDSQQHILSSSQVFSKYARLLQEFAPVCGLPGLYSPVGNLLPLNLQWKRFSERVRDIATPKFAYGFGVEKVDVSEFQQPIWKSPHDLYTWKQASSIKMPRFHTFVVDRPPGNPVLLYFVGEAAEVFPLQAEHIADENIKAKLLQCTHDIRDVFGAFMGEALFFVDRNLLTFAAFSHYMKTALADERFSTVLERGLVADPEMQKLTRN